MRIISQTRENDINYDMVELAYSKHEDVHMVVAVVGHAENIDRCCKLGTYSSKERCLKVMKSIRESYNIGAKFYQMPEE